MTLYSYWRSTTSLRIRAVLNLKGVAYSQISVDLYNGAQNDAGFTEISPTKGVQS